MLFIHTPKKSAGPQIAKKKICVSCFLLKVGFPFKTGKLQQVCESGSQTRRFCWDTLVPFALAPFKLSSKSGFFLGCCYVWIMSTRNGGILPAEVVSKDCVKADAWTLWTGNILHQTLTSVFPSHNSLQSKVSLPWKQSGVGVRGAEGGHSHPAKPYAFAENNKLTEGYMQNGRISDVTVEPIFNHLCLSRWVSGRCLILQGFRFAQPLFRF